MNSTDALAMERTAHREHGTAWTRAADQPAVVVTVPAEPVQAWRTSGVFAVHGENFALQTGDAVPVFHDLTLLAHAVVGRSAIDSGTLLVSTRHTTCAIIVQENEPLLLQDMVQRLRRFAGPQEQYHHNNFEIRTVNMCDGECANGHAHCQHLVLGSSVSLPVGAGHLVLGLWQRIFLVELDRSRLRHYSLQVMGVEAGSTRERS